MRTLLAAWTALAALTVADVAAANPPAPVPALNQTVLITALDVDLTPAAKHHVVLAVKVGTVQEWFGAGGSECPLGWDLSNADIDRLLKAMAAKQTVGILVALPQGMTMSCLAGYTISAPP